MGIVAICAANVWVITRAGSGMNSPAAHDPSHMVAIVPGARVEDRQPLWILERRLEAALGLYQSGQVKTILASGNDSEESPEVSVMNAWLRARGVPQHDILTDRHGFRTRETMMRASQVFGVERAIVCTEHLPEYMPAGDLARRLGSKPLKGTGHEPTSSPRWLVREALEERSPSLSPSSADRCGHLRRCPQSDSDFGARFVLKERGRAVIT